MSTEIPSYCSPLARAAYVNDHPEYKGQLPPSTIRNRINQGPNLAVPSEENGASEREKYTCSTIPDSTK